MDFLEPLVVGLLVGEAGIGRGVMRKFGNKALDGGRCYGADDGG